MTELSYRIDVIPTAGTGPIRQRVSSGVTRDEIHTEAPRADFAQALAAHFRIRRPEYGQRPIRVMVWETREGEHYRDDPPPSPFSTSHSYAAGAPAGHTCPECEPEGTTP